jgi:hypothetical protein
MSYSRWSSSTWYTFWSSDSKSNYALPTNKRKRAQVFEICDFPSYRITYGELIDKGEYTVLREIKAFYTKEHAGSIADSLGEEYEVEYSDKIFAPKNPTGQELLELSGYISKWQKEVEAAFTIKSYLKDLWNLKIKTGIINLFKNNIR